ncbi:MAG: DUF1553 domain-containing protein [Pirellulaceae bacterium]|nr:DUF1553 domain-containing protein [Pirellulaceae bacterium]
MTTLHLVTVGWVNHCRGNDSPNQPSSDPLPARVSQGLAAFYTFDMGDGVRRSADAEAGIVRDTAGQPAPLHLRIDKPQTVLFRSGRLDLSSAVTLAADGPATPLIRAVKDSGELTVEVWLKPQSAMQSGPARIVSLSLDTSLRNFTLGQDKGRFDVRLRTTQRDNNGQPSLATADDVLSTRLTHVLFSRTRLGQTRLFIDGQISIDSQIDGTFENWSDDYRLTIGNEVTGDRPWQGELYLVAIYARALSSEEVRQNFVAGVPRALNYAAKLPPAQTGPVDFAKDIRPLLEKHCYECHSADKEDGGLNLGMRRRALEGGDHGPVLTPGQSAESRLIHYVAALDKETAMPPGSSGLAPEEIGLLRAWIDQGAKWPTGIDIPDPRMEHAKTHWAFQPLQAVTLPEVKDANWSRSPIDRIVLKKLEEANIKPAARSDARTLIRRVTLDLIGLPPSPEEVVDFCRQAEVDFDAAYGQLLDRLLRSPHYGERWGRHWLDVARYADSDGQESDRDRPNAYLFRDFVISALNEDMPYDQFVRWQLAGDEYAPDDPVAVAAVGFLSAGPFAALPDRLMEDERLRNRYNELDDIVSTVGTGLLGLTLGCVRCHDHKYDAIPARDYYSLLSAFHGGERGEIEVGDAKQKVYTYHELSDQPKTTWLFQRGNYYDRDQAVSLGFVSIMTGAKSPDEYWQSARQASPAQSSTKQRRALAEWITDAELGAGPLLARVIVNRVWMHHFGPGLVRTVGDFGVRADAPSHPQLLDWLAHDFTTHGWRLKRLHRQILGSQVYQQSSQAAFQRQDPDNRWLWKFPAQRLEGEVLRDAMLAASGTLNLKAFGPAVKPPVANEAMLARNLKDKYPADIPDSPEQRRRSIYLFHKRVVPYPFLQAFDKPDAQQSCSRRDRTTVAPQALALLNDPFARTVAKEFADRLLKEQADLQQKPAPATPPATATLSTTVALPALVSRSYQLALARAPTPAQLEWAVAFIDSQMVERQQRQAEVPAEQIRQQAVADFCQVLFSLNEFVYVD